MSFGGVLGLWASIWNSGRTEVATADRQQTGILYGEGYYNRRTVTDWSFGKEILGVSTSITDEFIGFATKAWAAGVDKYRSGDESVPFDGDPLDEALQECIDLYCYSKEALKQELINETEADILNCHAFDAYKLIRRIVFNNNPVIAEDCPK